MLALSSCSRAGKTEAGGDPIKPPTVAVVGAAREDLSRDLELAAEFRPYQEIDVHAKVAGYLKEIYVDVGDRVQKGRLLAVLEIPELSDDLTRAAAAKELSDAEWQRAREEVERSQSAHAAAHLSYTRLAAVLQTRPNLVAQQEIDEALARDRVSEAQVSSAKAALAAAEDQVRVSQADEKKVRTFLDYSRITAPFPGIITKRYADTGAMIQAGTASQSQAMPVVRLSEVDRLRLVLPVPESIVPRVRIGAPVEVKVPALERAFEGRVSRSSGKVELSTRTMETEVDVLNPQYVLMPGMYAYAALTLDRREDALAVPVQAVSSREGKATVLVVDNRKQIQETPVALGIETPSKVEVLSGLKEGDLVVVGNRSQLRPGQTVEPKVMEPAAGLEAR
ncbi:MAG: efflux RND transporter periplasmic adaptor subunit [Acidobacteria bacterium]|nr:efflux RND transporter periplasmic adaptor subunit [Acidobacteriota bacterium]